MLETRAANPTIQVVAIPRFRRDPIHPKVRSKTPPEGYSVFLSYASSVTAIEHPGVPFSNAPPPWRSLLKEVGPS